MAKFEAISRRRLRFPVVNYGQFFLGRGSDGETEVFGEGEINAQKLSPHLHATSRREGLSGGESNASEGPHSLRKTDNDVGENISSLYM